jgi:D-amino-acid oxidase
MTSRVSIVGAGVMGLSIAHELAARGGCEVTVVAEQDALASVSSVAAAVWFPYQSGEFPSLMRLLRRARTRFEELADAEPGAGVDLREGTLVERTAGVDRWWAEAIPRSREASAAELPPGAVAGVRAVVPVISTSHYMAWLRRKVEGLGVKFVQGTVASIDELADQSNAEAVVVAAGLGSGALLGDDSMFPIRGQIVRLANPGLTEWIVDDDFPGGMTYVVPRRGDIVCGGVAEAGSWDAEISPETERAILERATALVPELAGLPVVSRAAGLRPARPAISLERAAGYRVPVVTCYGHGGSGVSLSWGCAEAAAELVVEAVG